MNFNPLRNTLPSLFIISSDYMVLLTIARILRCTPNKAGSHLYDPAILLPFHVLHSFGEPLGDYPVNDFAVSYGAKAVEVSAGVGIDH